MVRKGVEMKEKRKYYKELVHLGEYKNKLVYYDLKTKKLYFSIPERSSKNQQYVILSLVLLFLPFVRFLNGLTGEANFQMIMYRHLSKESIK